MRSQAELTAAAEAPTWYLPFGLSDGQSLHVLGTFQTMKAAISWALGEDGAPNPVAETRRLIDAVRRPDAGREGSGT